MLSSSTVSRLDSLVGLGGAKKVIQRLSEDDRGIHALLIYGAKGSGKSVIADLISGLWLCNNPTAEGADGTCRSCVAYARGSSPDILHIVPVGSSRIIRLSAITPPDQLKPDDPPTQLLPFFRTPPLYSRHKVAIFHDAERMNGSAANALLKTLEEPHPHAKLILVTDSVGSLLPTIISRCLAIACESPTEEEIRTSFPSATADQIRFAEGAPGRLQQMAKKQDAYERLASFARRLPHRKKSEALVAAEEFQQIAELFKESKDSSVRTANADALDALAIFCAREPGMNPRWTHLVIEAHRRILGNGGAPIVFDALFSSMLGS